MIKFFKNFSKNEDGAMTVDWVVLTAAVVGLGIAGVTAVNTGITDLANEIQTSLEAGDVTTDLTTLGQ